MNESKLISPQAKSVLNKQEPEVQNKHGKRVRGFNHRL